ncbi:hypothetical protein EJ110_NYTH38662 [Nymphaea thermarum]|nr:hypothetical protein EJ110_NYTH38662 [Nymphaea thermarum]
MDIIFNNEFWESCLKLLKVYVPLVKVLKTQVDWTTSSTSHAVACYLNPVIRFSTTLKKDRKVTHGLLNCVSVLVTYCREQDVVHSELDLYDSCFGHGTTRRRSSQDNHASS